MILDLELWREEVGRVGLGGRSGKVWWGGRGGKREVGREGWEERGWEGGAENLDSLWQYL